MAFCEKTDFIGDINLPAEFLNSDRFDAFLLKYEKMVLIKLLGYDLYKKFTDGLDQIVIAQKWVNLRDGLEYTIVNGTNVQNVEYYSGMVDILKYFVYFFISDAIQSELTITGEVSAKNENSVVSSPAPRVTGLWNDGVDNAMDMKKYIEWYNENYSDNYSTFVMNENYFKKMNLFSI